MRASLATLEGLASAMITLSAPGSALVLGELTPSGESETVGCHSPKLTGKLGFDPLLQTPVPTRPTSLIKWAPPFNLTIKFYKLDQPIKVLK